MHQKRILVAGGAGFLGSHLCIWLLKQGHHIIAMDNLSSGRKENIEAQLSSPHFSFIQADIAETHPFTDQIKQEIGPVDEIYNFACQASPPFYQASPIATIRTNTIGVLNLLELATAYQARFLQASTSEIYGDPLVHPQQESYWGNVNPIGPRSSYVEGKRIAESTCFEYKRNHDLDIKIIRIFNTYGPNMSPADGRVVSNFIMQALEGKPITIYGNGSQTRSFCYVDDLIDGVIRMMASPKTPAGVLEPVNLGYPGEYTIREFAEKILAMTDSSSTIIYHDLPLDDPTKRQPDISRANQVLGWHPSISLEEGLAKTIPYFQKVLKK